MELAAFLRRKVQALAELVGLDLMLDSSTLIFVEEHVVVVWLQHVSLAWQNAPLSVELVGSIAVELGATEAEVRGGIWTLRLLLLFGVDAELASLEVGGLEVSGSVVLARIDASLDLELGLSSKGNVALVPIESLVQTVGDASLRLVAGIYWSYAAAFVFLVALILIPL